MNHTQIAAAALCLIATPAFAKDCAFMNSRQDKINWPCVETTASKLLSGELKDENMGMVAMLMLWSEGRLGNLTPLLLKAERKINQGERLK